MSAFTSPTFLNEYYLTTCNFDDIQGRAGQEFSVKFQPYSNKGLWIDGAIFSRGANIASQSQRNAIKTNWVDIAPGDAIFMKPAIMYVNRINLQFQKILQSVVGFFYQDFNGPFYVLVAGFRGPRHQGQRSK
jgi:hypothetical protein